MADYKKILNEELGKISLSSEETERLNKLAKDFLEKLNDKGVKAQMGGSLAKGTMVRREGKQDVDVFVIFDYSEDILKLEKVLKKIKLPGVLKKVHGSRDYFQIECPGLILEVVPVVKNSDPELAENVTDVSLSHVKYIRGAIKKYPELAGEIKLAKAFCRAQGFYGAESYIHGFSGYSLEVLVIHFGGFVKFLKGISKKRVIDPLRYFRNEREIKGELNSSKLQGPIVLIDPTYKYRNVCAGLGEESFNNFLVVSKNFLKKPSLDFFEKQEVDVASLKKFAKSKGALFLEIDLKTDRQEGDIAGTKMKKFLDFFVKELGRKQQKVLKKEFYYSGEGQSARGYLVVLEVPEIEIRGPSIHMEEIASKFKKAKGKSYFERKGYCWAREKVSVKSIFISSKKVEEEMGAGGVIHDIPSKK